MPSKAAAPSAIHCGGVLPLSAGRDADRAAVPSVTLMIVLSGWSDRGCWEGVKEEGGLLLSVPWHRQEWGCAGC